MRILADEKAIKKAQRAFESAITAAADAQMSTVISHPSGQFPTAVYWVSSVDLWAYFGVPPNEKSPGQRYWNVFGLGKPAAAVSIICEINPPIRGIYRRPAGAFAGTAAGTSAGTSVGTSAGRSAGVWRVIWEVSWRGPQPRPYCRERERRSKGPRTLTFVLRQVSPVETRHGPKSGRAFLRAQSDQSSDRFDQVAQLNRLRQELKILHECLSRHA